MDWTLDFYRDDRGHNWIVIVDRAGRLIDTYHPWLLDSAHATASWYNDIQRRARLVNLAAAA